MYPQSNQALRAPSRCINEHNNLVQELDDAQNHCSCGDSTVFCATNQSTCHCTTTGASTTSQTVPVKVHGLLHSVHCAYQDLHAAGMSTTLLMN